MSAPDLMEKIISLAKRRGFIFPGSEIYGGLANSWDFGPLGTELKNNIKKEWWRRFVQSREDVVGIETALIMNPQVWEASGHLKEFADLLAECKKCKGRFRIDEIASSPPQSGGSLPAGRQARNDKKKPIITGPAASVIASPRGAKQSHRDGAVAARCPSCGAGLSAPRKFNLLFKTFIGPVEDAAAAVYLRPETAQGMFVNFENVVNTVRPRLPFGIAQIGKAFRNEVTPGNYIFRTREFEQMEIEYFVKEKDWKKYFENWLKDMKSWLADLGIDAKNVRYKEMPEKERAHYSKRTVDILYKFPFGDEEMYGLAYRGDFDLKNHKQSYTDSDTGEKFVPHVIEPTWGVERTVLALLLEHYYEETVNGEVRTVLGLPVWLAPYKTAVLPLSKKAPLVKLAKQVYKDLLADLPVDYDETQSIGRRYRRQDEIGTPYCVTIDFDSPKGKDVTVRDRDTMKQERIKISDLKNYLLDLSDQ